MNNYDFTTLNDKEFEQLAKDLLNAKYNLRLQNFTAGKDKGVDLRFSTSKNNNSLVVQVKHYAGSGFSQLKHTLAVKELDKIKKLSPDRYIVVTSLPLSAIQKDEIKSALSPYILDSNDIFGKEDLNGMLNEFKEIEKNYFKLWFSSLTILQVVLNNAIEGRTKYMLEKINKKIQFYVATKNLNEGLKILIKEKLLLITGQPGIGKTTLAEIILFDRAKNGFKIYKVENILETESMISQNHDEKQLFYFDDFLGANYFEIVNTNKTETQLTSFIERVKSTPNKYLILTTRTIILNQAIEKYEKISHSQIAKQQFELKLQDYTNYEKALILYNHIYFRKIKEELFDSIISDKYYLSIIKHKNYTPRIIEFITDKNRIDQLTSTSYRQFIFNNLRNPKEIWRYSFSNQIDYLDRCLLLTLFSFENDPLEITLIAAFENRLQYEVTEHNQIITANQFHESMRILLNGFVLSSLIDIKESIRDYSFINPSLADFLIGYVSDSYPERKSIVSSILYIEQLDRFNPNKKIIPLERELQIIIAEKISSSQLNSIRDISLNKKYAIYLDILMKYCYSIDTDLLLLNTFQKIDIGKYWGDILAEIEYFLDNTISDSKVFSYVKQNFILIIEKYIDCITNSDSAINVISLFEKYGYNYDEYVQFTQDGLENIIGMIHNVIESAEYDLKSEYESEIKERDEVYSIYDEIYSLESNLASQLLPRTSLHYNFDVSIDWNYWEERIKKNIQSSEDEEFSFDDYDEDAYIESRIESRNEGNEIDDLFSKNF